LGSDDQCRDAVGAVAVLTADKNVDFFGIFHRSDTPAPGSQFCFGS
jgi:hypothetical protein